MLNLLVSTSVSQIQLRCDLAAEPNFSIESGLEDSATITTVIHYLSSTLDDLPQDILLRLESARLRAIESRCKSEPD